MPKPLHPRDSQARKEDSVRRAAEWLCGELSMSQDEKKCPKLREKNIIPMDTPNFGEKNIAFPLTFSIWGCIITEASCAAS